MSVASVVTRTLLSVAAVGVFKMVDTAHEIVSPLISGPMAAQQLSDSNAAYIGTQTVSRLFNGAGVSPLITVVLLGAALIAIWYQPVVNFFKSTKV